jgi:hypothetical protein
MADIQVLKAAAFRLSERLQLDAMVRAASRLGHQEGPNWQYDHVCSSGLRIQVGSTDGAGTNTAEVWIDTPEQRKQMQESLSLDWPALGFPGQVVYRCHQHGQQLDVLRDGWWVPIVLTLAWDSICRQTTGNVIGADQRAAKEALAFTPLPH